MQHGLPVLQHVGDARRRAGIVLEHVKFVLAGAHQIGADNVCVDAARRLDADHLRQERLVLRDQLDRYAPGPQNLLAMIDVVKEGVDRGDALLDAA